MIRTLAVLAALLAAPAAFAQATASEAADVDPAIVGDWTLMKVEALGEMGRYGADVQEMWCSFDADGTGEVRLSFEQDQDVMDRARTFQFTTDGGKIESTGAPEISYQVYGGDLLVLRMESGLVVQLRRIGERG